jgi:HK97 family phage major capsid protein
MELILKEKGEALEAKRQAAYDFYSQFEKRGDQQAKVMSSDDLVKFNAMRQEVDDLQTEFEGIKSAYDFGQANKKALDDGRRVDPTPGYKGGTGGGREAKTLGQRLIESAQYKNRNGSMVAEIGFDDFDVKATMTTGANGYPPEVLRNPGVTLSIQRPIQLLDLLPMRPTTQNGIKFMKETVFTNAAAAKAETGAAAEATLTYAEQNLPIERIPVFIPISEIQLEDEPGLRALADDRLMFMVRQELDRQAAVGTGANNELTGLANAADIQTQAKGADDVLDALYKGQKKVRVDGRCSPSAYLIHPNDWMGIRLTKTADGVYIYGAPTEAGVLRLWGLPVAELDTLTEGTSMCWDLMNHVTLVLRSGVAIAVTNSHSNNFINGVLAIRATTRAGLEIRRGQAGCKITGLAA